MSLSDARSFIDCLAEGSVRTAPHSFIELAQRCESYFSLWTLSVISTGHVSLKGSKLGDEQPQLSDLAVLKPLYLPGQRAFPKGSLLRCNHADEEGRKGETYDKLPDDSCEAAISLVSGERS